jgi:hypothetical protein
VLGSIVLSTVLVVIAGVGLTTGIVFLVGQTYVGITSDIKDIEKYI